ncbi:MAG: hypothetical protein IJM18_06020 [Clostridia bacterium]|nr:hypothetical protein [Clostridia bacterium]
MSKVKEAWKQVEKDLDNMGKTISDTNIVKEIEQFGTDLGKSVVKTVKQGIRKVNEWAAEDDQPVNAKPEEPKQEPVGTEAPKEQPKEN